MSGTQCQTLRTGTRPPCTQCLTLTTPNPNPNPNPTPNPNPDTLHDMVILIIVKSIGVTGLFTIVRPIVIVQKILILLKKTFYVPACK